jgi:23S rRNA (adenine-N6)-dimethyltransferase
MRYKLRRKLLSQNFLRNPKLVAKLIRKTSIGKSDTVIEVGPGKGVITSELVKVAGKVVAVELDLKLYMHLKNKFATVQNLNLINADFLKINLPSYTYKVFANIPFIITADAIRKLTSDRNFQEGYLVVQKEAAQKFIGKPYDRRNQMISMLLKPWFEIEVLYKFKRLDFLPIPNVDIVMIKIEKRNKPLLPSYSLNYWSDWVIYTYNSSKIARLDYDELVKRYEYHIKNASNYDKKRTSLLARKIIEKQKNIQKIHRTRKDRN